MISIVVAAYNSVQYISACIDSVLAQTLHDWQLVIVDDGSSDGTSKICDEYADRDKHISVIHQPNAGVSVARNVGIQASMGEYILLLDGDDMLHPKCLEALSDSMEYPGVCVVSCDMLESKTPSWSKIVEVQPDFYAPKQAIIDTLYQNRLNCSCCGKLFRRDCLGKNLFEPGLRFEDLDAFYRIYENVNGVIAHLPLKLYFYRTNSSSYINTFTPSRLDVLDVTRKIEEHYQGQPEILAAARDRRFSANCNSLLLCLRCGQYDIARQCWKFIKKRRSEEIKNRNIRLKNRLGAFATYAGYNIIKCLARLTKG